jgi:hypothetical protein
MNNFNMFPNMMFGMDMMQNKPYICDPSKIDPRVRKTLISQNISQCKIGMYKMIKPYKPVTCQFEEKYNPGPPTNICEISVVYEHSVDAVEKYTEKGINASQKNNMNPVVLNVVGKDFTGTSFESNEDIRDQLLNLRTSFNNTIGTQSPYPVKLTECVYSKSVIAIRSRNPFMGFLPYPQIYRFSLITTSPIHKPDMIDDERMCTRDYVKTCSIIESIFQTAIAGYHPVLVLCPFGHEVDENSVQDVIRIYNYCIYKYGHKFNHIVIAVPPYYPKGIFDEYDKNIVRLQNIVGDVDKQHDSNEMHSHLIEQSEKLEKSKKGKKDQKSNDVPLQHLEQAQQPDQQMIYNNMMQMMQQNPAMFMTMMSQYQNMQNMQNQQS